MPGEQPGWDTTGGCNQTLTALSGLAHMSAYTVLQGSSIGLAILKSTLLRLTARIRSSGLIQLCKGYESGSGVSVDMVQWRYRTFGWKAKSDDVLSLEGTCSS